MEPKIPGFDSLPTPINDLILGYDAYRSTETLKEASSKVKDLTTKPEFWQRIANLYNITIKEPINARNEVLTNFTEINGKMFEYFNDSSYLPYNEEAANYIRNLKIPTPSNNPIATFLEWKDFIAVNSQNLDHLMFRAMHKFDYKLILLFIENGILPNNPHNIYQLLYNIKSKMILKEEDYTKKKEIFLQIVNTILPKWSQKERDKFFDYSFDLLTTASLKNNSFVKRIIDKKLWNTIIAQNVTEIEKELHDFELQIWRQLLDHNVQITENHILRIIEENRVDLLTLIFEKKPDLFDKKYIDIARSSGREKIRLYLEEKFKNKI